MPEQACYHCGLPIPPGVDISVAIGGEAREMCCSGCQAVAQSIVANGLTDYYRHRDALPESPREALPQALQDLGLFDHPDVQRSFVRDAPGEHEREAALILEGITCAACVWLNEQHLARQPGVTGVDINYATRRARVRWDERHIKLSQILEAIAAIGYRAHPYDVARSEELAQKERKIALWRLFVAAFGMMQVMMYAVPVYLADEGTMTPEIHRLMQWASLVLTMPVVLYSAAPFFRSAWRDLRLRRVGMDVPVALGVGSAFVASTWATLTASGEVYFDSVTMFVFFLLGGRYLEMMARQRAVRGVETLNRALPAVAARLMRWPEGIESERVAVAELLAGDLVLVKPGEGIPADGCVIDGASSVDESLLTGESRPVAKSADDSVIGGSVNVGSPLVVRVQRVGDETRLAAIRRLMEQAAADKPRLVVMADRFASRFVVALLVMAALTAVAWHFIDNSRTLSVFVAVLVVSCPCALSLATPAALTVATGAMAQTGLLVARGHAIETLARTTHVVFDKTGTLTHGHMTLLQVLAVGAVSESELRLTAAAMERGSEHPLARALCAGTESLRLPFVESVRAYTGSGLEGNCAGTTLRLGNLTFAGGWHAEAIPSTVEAWIASGDTIVALSDSTGWLGFFRFGDAPREEAASVITELNRLGIHTSVFSGDGERAVCHLATQLGVNDAQGNLSPEDKHIRLKSLQGRGAIVAMVGDGVNDAPVLAQAQVSVAMGGGTELARGQADSVLLSEDLRHLVGGISLARRTVRIVRQNLTWALAYNLVAIPLAMSGVITPWMAGIGMSASSLLVVLNALRLQSGANKVA